MSLSPHPDDKIESVPLTSKEDEVSASISTIPSLPPPVSSESAPSKPKSTLSVVIIFPIWVAFSLTVILYNNYLYNTVQFRYPVFLVTLHLIFSAIGTRVLQWTTNLLDGKKDVDMNKDIFLRSILPISLFFSGSLILSNLAYLHLSISFIIVLKAFNAVAVLLISWSFRIAEPNWKLALIVCIISFGVALTSKGELHFSLLGLIIQAAAVVGESSRLVMIEVLLHRTKMDPLVSLHYYAPVCALINLIFLPFTEGLAPFYQLTRIDPLILLSNAFAAFSLNVAAVFLISVSSGLGLTLAGVVKDILLITGSVIFFGAQVAPLQIYGYSIALAGLVLYIYKTTGRE
ncbi:triose-phosphate transporter family-domain-containing protein [Mycena rebaudengoi]|nr:triose-phosphate transporter family-domain-containing protein [Mycena rebaudengoi]